MSLVHDLAYQSRLSPFLMTNFSNLWQPSSFQVHTSVSFKGSCERRINIQRHYIQDVHYILIFDILKSSSRLSLPIKANFDWQHFFAFHSLLLLNSKIDRMSLRNEKKRTRNYRCFVNWTRSEWTPVGWKKICGELQKNIPIPTSNVN